MIESELVAEITVNNVLGEAILWDHRDQSVWWTDIMSNKLYRWTFANKLDVYNTPEPVCSFALTSRPSKFVVAFASGFAQFDPITQDTKWICKVEADIAHTRLNDGRVDRQGRFWAGSMQQRADGPLGNLYCLQGEHAQRHKSQIEISNGLCWSNDGQIIYHADSPKRLIEKADFDPQSGKANNWRPFVTTAKNAFPDGACVDSRDHLWSAQWGSATVKCYTPEGLEKYVLDLPCLQPSCVTFGGAELDYLFVTSATQGLSNRPKGQDGRHDGNMFIYKTSVIGVEESVCKLQ